MHTEGTKSIFSGGGGGGSSKIKFTGGIYLRKLRAPVIDMHPLPTTLTIRLYPLSLEIIQILKQKNQALGIFHFQIEKHQKPDFLQQSFLLEFLEIPNPVNEHISLI